MHVYHYGGYESGALKRLMGEHGDARGARSTSCCAAGCSSTCYTVVRQALRVGVRATR